MTKILVIQSELSIFNNSIFIKLLESEGFDVVVSENANVGLCKAQSDLPDLIISDIIMSELDGYGILKALRENIITAIIPFIFLTNEASQSDIRKAMEMGADDIIIMKSCTEEEFLKAIIVRLERQAFLKKCYTIHKAKEIE
ncbi:MAG: response regulator [Cyanobacteria bacterium J06628_3]